MSISDADVRVIVRPDVHTRMFDGELVLLDLEKGDYFGVNEVGAELWKRLAEGKSPREIARELEPQYDVEPERLLEDLVALTSELLARGLVRRKETP